MISFHSTKILLPLFSAMGSWVQNLIELLYSENNPHLISVGRWFYSTQPQKKKYLAGGVK